MTITIYVEFDPQVLPRWAQQNVAVVDYCKHDLVYRCRVCEARTKRMQKDLIHQAEQRAQGLR